MVTDYDTLRVREETDPAAEILARLDTRRAEAAAATLVDDEETVGLDVLDVHHPGLLGDDHTITVLARQPDEFVCSRCFLVHHRSRYARALLDRPICRDCA
jgi:hypothetical protein